DLGGDRLGDLDIKVGRFEGELRFLRLDQHVGENWNGVAPLDHAVDMAERLQQRCAFDGDFHFSIRPLAWKPRRGKEGGAGARFSQGRGSWATAVTQRIWPRSRPAFPLGTAVKSSPARQFIAGAPLPPRPFQPCKASGRLRPAALAHSCNCRFSSSISSASAESVLTRFSILRTACSTV